MDQGKNVNYGNQQGEAVSVYNAMTIGYYLKDVTTDYKRFNDLIQKGMPMEEILRTEQRNPWSFAFGYHMIYSYFIEGKWFVRASEETSYRRDRYLAIEEKMYQPYEVFYLRENPYFATIQVRLDRSKNKDQIVQVVHRMEVNPQPIQVMPMVETNPIPVQAPPKDTEGIVAFVCGILSPLFFCTVIGSLICGVLAIVFAVKAKQKGSNQKALIYVGMGLGIVGIIVSILFVVLYIMFGLEQKGVI